MAVIALQGRKGSSPGVSNGSSSTHTVTGTLEVIYPTAPSAGSPCYVPPDWGNESDGDQVVVANGSGTTLGVGSLTDGTAVDTGGGGCQFTFAVPGVADSSFYTVTIDGHSGPQYSESQLQGNGWTVSLSLTP